MKLLTLTGGALGAGLAVWLLARYGLHPVLALLRQAGWGLLPVVGFHLVQMLFSSLGWRAIAGRAAPRPGVADFLMLRWVREGVNALLPVAQVGGEFAAVRLLRRRGVPLVRACAATVCDLTVEMLTQILFTLAGLLLLLALIGRGPVADEVVGGIGVALLVGVTFLASQWLGLARLVEGGLTRLAARFGWQGMDEIRGLHQALVGLYRAPRQLGLAILCQSVSWLLGAVEVWLALRVLGHGRGLPACLVIESLGQAVRAAGFMVPASLGVSEGGFVLIGSLFGLVPAASIALALVKRLREVALGLPALAAWQWLDRHWQPPGVPRPGSRAAGTQHPATGTALGCGDAS